MNRCKRSKRKFFTPVRSAAKCRTPGTQVRTSVFPHRCTYCCALRCSIYRRACY